MRSGFDPTNKLQVPIDFSRTISNIFQIDGYKFIHGKVNSLPRSYGLMDNFSDFESEDLSSNLGGIIFIKIALLKYI